MRRSTRLNVTRFLAIVALVLSSASSYAQDVLDEIAKHQERINKIVNDITVSQRRITASANTSPAQDRAYERLNSVYFILTSADQQFQALTQLLMLESVVTEKRAIPYARRIVESQEDHMAERFQVSAQFAENILSGGWDPETTRLLLEARDVLKASADLVVRLKKSKAKWRANK